MTYWSRSATATLRHIHATIAADQPAAAIRIVEAIRDSADMLAQHPHLGLQTKRRGILRFPVPHTKYVLIYQIEADGVTIVLIFRGAQNWKRR